MIYKKIIIILFSYFFCGWIIWGCTFVAPHAMSLQRIPIFQTWQREEKILIIFTFLKLTYSFSFEDSWLFCFHFCVKENFNLFLSVSNFIKHSMVWCIIFLIEEIVTIHQGIWYWTDVLKEDITWKLQLQIYWFSYKYI